MQMTVILSQLQDNETSHGPVINDFVKWREEPYLELNISNTKNIITGLKDMTTDKVTSLRVRQWNVYNPTNVLGEVLTEN